VIVSDEVCRPPVPCQVIDFTTHTALITQRSQVQILPPQPIDSTCNGRSLVSARRISPKISPNARPNAADKILLP